MQDAADEITLRDEEGALRPEFLHAVEAALEAGDTKTGARAHARRCTRPTSPI